jgi:hypothetical protein
MVISYVFVMYINQVEDNRVKVGDNHVEAEDNWARVV